MTIHELKSWPEWFDATVSGRKTFDVRINDRGFTVGDRLLLREWNPESEQYTGRSALFDVTYVMDTDGDVISRGISSDYVVMAIAAVPDWRARHTEV